MNAKRIGILGGTFDPFHNGHLMLMKTARRALQLDHVFCVPSYQNPLKAKCVTGARHRAAMVRLSVNALPDVSLCYFEIRRKKPSFTIDTVRYFRKRFGACAEIFVICGSDIAGDLKEWKNYPVLKSLCRFAITHRAGEKPIKKYAGVEYFRMNPVRASATELRSAGASDKGWKVSVPPTVLNYIRRHKLYSFSV